MKAVVSTVSEASVTVAGEKIAEVKAPALLALVGAGREDTPDSWKTMARKIAELRLFPADTSQMNGEHWDGVREASVAEARGSVLLVSQFTLMGRTARPAPIVVRCCASRRCCTSNRQDCSRVGG